MRTTSLFLPLALMACNDIGLQEVHPELIHESGPIELGRIAVGDTSADTVQLDLDRDRGTVEIVQIGIRGDHADQFAYLGGPSLEVVGTESTLLELAYQPTEEGWHAAELWFKVRQDAKGSGREVAIPIRGRAMLPELLVLPGRADFGPVDEGSLGTKTITVRNLGDLDVTVDGYQLSVPGFDLGTVLPLEVGAGDERQLQLRYAAPNEAPASDVLVLSVGSVDLQRVELIANDCLAGEPAAWDRDGDGFTSCASPADCDDNRIDVSPAAPELADGLDNDCDGVADEGTDWFDDDGDGFCEGPGACTDGALPGDCNDARIDAAPDAPELADNGVDDDCDGVVDTGTTDADGDGYAPAGGDCDDLDPARYPGGPELPDGLDNDCDGLADEGTVVFDDDGDGYCEGPAACTDGSMVGDCDDGNVDTSPGAPEAADWRDNDCDTQVDEGTLHADGDGDGYSPLGGDCDDTDPANNPATTGISCP